MRSAHEISDFCFLGAREAHPQKTKPYLRSLAYRLPHFQNYCSFLSQDDYHLKLGIFAGFLSVPEKVW